MNNPTRLKADMHVGATGQLPSGLEIWIRSSGPDGFVKSGQRSKLDRQRDKAGDYPGARVPQGPRKLTLYPLVVLFMSVNHQGSIPAKMGPFVVL